ncbi:MAG: DUF4923 family protein [Alistipes sp.]|nr:DUF4923 family protein [Alistipes sp.]
MKRILYVVICCFALMFTSNTQAQSLEELFNSITSLLGSTSTTKQDVEEKPIYPTEKELTGTWIYSQPEIVYDGDDALATMAISSVKSQLPALMQSFGFIPGRDYAIVKGSKIVGVNGDRKAKATYTYNATNGRAIITGENNGKKITVTGHLTIKDGKITILCEAKELIAIASQHEKFKENSMLQMAASIITSYPGIKVGVVAKKN